MIVCRQCQIKIKYFVDDWFLRIVSFQDINVRHVHAFSFHLNRNTEKNSAVKSSAKVLINRPLSHVTAPYPRHPLHLIPYSLTLSHRIARIYLQSPPQFSLLVYRLLKNVFVIFIARFWQLLF